MTERTQRAIELFIDRRVPSLNHLSLSWFGGEPLLTKDIVLRIANHAYRVCEENGVNLLGGMTTNGYLLDRDLFQKLLAVNHNFFQITLDGWEEHHDTLRRRADGKGTFGPIWSHLMMMREIDQHFEIVVRIHVRRDNVENLVILMEQFAKNFSHDARFRLDFQNLRDLGGDGGKTVIAPITSEEADVLRERYLGIVYGGAASSSGGAIGNRAGQIDPKRPIGESAGSRRSGEFETGEPYICYAARPNSILVRANGRIGKCTVAFSDPRNDLGYIADDGLLHINNAKLQPWIRGLGSLENQETACPLDGMPPSDLVSPVYGARVVPIVAVVA